MPHDHLTISVVIPVYNTERYLERCIRSLLSQTRAPDELIFVNDGSIDGSMDILTRYAAGDPRIRILFQPNRGLSAARNVGIESAQGDCLYFMDSDDYLHSQALQLAGQALEETKRDFVIFDLESVPPSAQAMIQPHCEFPRLDLWDTPLADFADSKNRMPCVWRFLYRRRSLGNLRFVEGLIYEDLCFTPLYLLRAGSGVYLPLPLYAYVQTEGSLSRRQQDLSSLQHQAWIFRHLAAAFRDRPWAHRILNRTFAVPRIKTLRKQIIPRRGSPRNPQLAAALRAMCGALLAEKAILLKGFSLRWKLWLLRQRFANHPPEVAGFPTPDNLFTR